jgi:hypothetical protein
VQQNLQYLKVRRAKIGIRDALSGHCLSRSVCLHQNEPDMNARTSGNNGFRHGYILTSRYRRCKGSSGVANQNLWPIVHQQKQSRLTFGNSWLNTGRRHNCRQQRHLVKQYGASPVTVQRALAILVREGLIYSRSGQGAFVALHREPPKDSDFSWQTVSRRSVASNRYPTAVFTSGCRWPKEWTTSVLHSRRFYPVCKLILAAIGSLPRPAQLCSTDLRCGR